MNKHLPNKTDNFFLHHLKDFGEEPGESIWAKINRRLTEKANAKSAKSKFIIFSATAVTALLLCAPLLITEYAIFHFYTVTKDVVNRNNYQQNNLHIYSQTMEEKELANNNRIIKTDKNIKVFNNLPKNDYALAEIFPSNYLKKFITTEHKQQLNELYQLKFIAKNLKNEDANNTSSINIKLRTKHNFSIMPFFSADHISGRFIEQYEFDNLNKDDYDKREKPDLSFTTGILAAYQLNNKLSLLSGLSFSSSNLSITTTAVKALADATGAYKFKLATSYGLAEITKSGIIPNAGDSLLISSASMQFNYISFPLLLRYDLGGKKIKYSVHSGFAINKLLSEKVEAEYEARNIDEDETINKIEGIRKTFFTLNTGVEVKYQLNKKTDISISPELRYGINAINKGTPVRTYPVNYGLSVNLNFKL